MVTETDTYEHLIERAWQIAPELAKLNQLGIDSKAIRLRFLHEPVMNYEVLA